MLKSQTASVIVSAVISILFVVASVHAATTVSTSVTTGGSLFATSTLNVSGLSTLSAGFVSVGSSTVVGAFTATGDTSLQRASTTQFSNIQTSNTATTSAYLGCIQTYATTTAKPVKLTFYATSTVNGVTTSGGVSTGAGGYVLFEFGTCP